jgi:hypothetical protein
MKKTIFFIAAIFALSSISLSAQWAGTTNIYNNNTGYVGISGGGSSFTPTEQLQLTHGNFLMDYGFETTGSFYMGGKPETGVNGLKMVYTGIGGPSGACFDVRTTDPTGGFIFRTDKVNGQTERMRIQSNGNVGIGTSSPVSGLHLHNSYFKVSGTNAFGGPMVVLGNSVNGDWGMEYMAGSYPGLNFWKPGGSTNSGNYYLFLADNGNIGVGTNDPGSFKMAVEGKLGAREIKVTLASPWPDYVFGDGYQLKPLTEVEEYIHLNKHLPGIPSAEEMVNNNGIDLGSMQTLQIEKVEEIYLYMIELNKRLDLLEAENKLLKDELSKMNNTSK